MPNYNDLRPEDDLKKKGFALTFPEMLDVEKKRTIQNLLLLRAGLRKEVAVKKAENNLLVASWNIKEFGHTTQRLDEAYFYIAEIISTFDLVAVQEIVRAIGHRDRTAGNLRKISILLTKPPERLVY